MGFTIWYDRDMLQNKLLISVTGFIILFIGSLITSNEYHSYIRNVEKEVKGIADTRPTVTPTPTYAPTQEDLEFVELQKKIKSPLNDDTSSISPSPTITITASATQSAKNICVFEGGSKCGDKVETEKNCSDIVCCTLVDKNEILTRNECETRINENNAKYEEIKKQYESEQQANESKLQKAYTDCVNEAKQKYSNCGSLGTCDSGGSGSSGSALNNDIQQCKNKFGI